MRQMWAVLYKRGVRDFITTCDVNTRVCVAEEHFDSTIIQNSRHSL